MDKLTEALQALDRARQLMVEAQSQAAQAGQLSHPIQPEPGSPPPMSWGKRLSLPARRFLTQMGQDYGRPPDDFTDCFALETGETFRPSIRNPHSSGTGLIQFMDATCVELSKRWGLLVTTASLAAMSVEEQLPWVWKYIKMMTERVGLPKSREDVYMLIYWPAAVGKPLDTVLHSKGTSAYAGNQGLDVNRDGRITKAEAGLLVAAKAEKGRLPDNYG